MSRPNVDEVLNYLSIKFNKIFCDRDFVCCVIQDFQTVLDNKNKICMRKRNVMQRKRKSSCDLTSYVKLLILLSFTFSVLVFPALGPIYLKALRYQARIFDLAVFNITSASGKFKSFAVCHKEHLKKTNQVNEETMSESVSKRKRPARQLYIPPAQRASRLSAKQCDKKLTPEVKEKDPQCSSDFESVLLTLSDVLNLIYFFNTLPCGFQKSKFCYQHNNCEFKRFLNFKNDSFIWDQFIKIYNNSLLLNNLLWPLSEIKCINQSKRQFKSYPVYDFDNLDLTIEEHPAVLVNFQINDFSTTISALHEFENSFYEIECDISCDDLENCYILDLSVIGFGHFFLISIEGSDYFHECQEKHNATVCCKNIRKQLVDKNVEKSNKSDAQNNKTMNENDTKTIMKNQINKNKKVSNNKHEQEKEIMRMTKEYINRKTRPIMKYVDDSNDTLRIDKNDSVNNWEDLFDDNGEIQENLLTEIVDKVGDDITIVKASEDYTAYTNKPPEDLEHIVELYNFPPTLETHDLVQAFSDINSDAMYIKWVDDTHALLVLGSLSQAQKAVDMNNPLIKVRPMTAASAISIDVANKSDLKPAMKRPPTNLQTARRLITSHLGTKSKVTKEQMAKEKQDLKNARERKRLLKQNEKDAWEGNLRSSVN